MRLNVPLDLAGNCPHGTNLMNHQVNVNSVQLELNHTFSISKNQFPLIAPQPLGRDMGVFAVLDSFPNISSHFRHRVVVNSFRYAEAADPLL